MILLWKINGKHFNQWHRQGRFLASPPCQITSVSCPTCNTTSRSQFPLHKICILQCITLRFKLTSKIWFIAPTSLHALKVNTLTIKSWGQTVNLHVMLSALVIGQIIRASTSWLLGMNCQSMSYPQWWISSSRSSKFTEFFFTYFSLLTVSYILLCMYT